MDLTGLLAAGGVLAAASAFGVWRKRTDGAVRELVPAGAGAGPGSDPEIAPGSGADRLTPADLGLGAGRSTGTDSADGDAGAVGLHPRATLVQFSSKVCRYCGPTRRLLSELADRHAVSFVEIDAEERLDLARRLSILRTPTVLLLDHDGRITHRVSGPPRRAELAAAVSRLAPDPA